MATGNHCGLEVVPLLPEESSHSVNPMTAEILQMHSLLVVVRRSIRLASLAARMVVLPSSICKDPGNMLSQVVRQGCFAEAAVCIFDEKPLHRRDEDLLPPPVILGSRCEGRGQI